MASTVRLVDPDNGAGTDFTSLSAWEAAVQSLGVSGDTHTAQCRSSAGTADTTAVVIAGWIAGVTPVIRAVSGHEASKTGWDATKYRLTPNATAALTVQIANTDIKGIQIAGDKPLGSSSGFFLNSSNATGVVVDACYITKNVAGGASSEGVSINASGVTITIVNSVVRSLLGVGISAFNHAGCNIYNCVVEGCGTGIKSGDSVFTLNAKNNAVFNNSIDFGGAGLTNYDTNASDSGAGTNPISPAGGVWTTEFQDSTVGNFTLLNTGNLFNAGIGPSVDAIVPVLDMDGDSRSGTVSDIGVDEFVSGGPTLTTAVFRRRREGY